MKPRILVIDDEPAIRDSLKMILEYEDYEFVGAPSGTEGVAIVRRDVPDMVILDIKMPGMNGLETLAEIRKLDEALGLAMGADDYISKPFSQRLLIARIRAILRRQDLAQGEVAASNAQSEPPLLERGRLIMDPARHKVRWDGKDVTLTVTEFLILEALAQRPGVVKTRNQLLDVAYQDDVYVDDRTIDSHIKRIRRKFRASDPGFDAIETLYGVGYRFDEQ